MEGTVRRTEQGGGSAATGFLNRVFRLPNLLFIGIITLYKKMISPILPSVCRFEPSCSEYGRQAFRKYNFFKAFGLTAWRILRCNPFCRGGQDPLP